MPAPEPIPNFDLYAELEVAPSASSATIDAAWRSLVKRHHPDAQRDVTDAAPRATERIRRLNIAHDWLADPERRARYDRERVLRPDAAWRSAPERGAAAAPTPSSVDWREVRREWSREGASASSARSAQPQSLIGSPIFLAALVAIVAVFAVGGVLIVAGLLTSPPPVSDAGAPPDADAGVAVSPQPSPTLGGAGELADTIPDRVDGIVLLGESGTGVELFGADAGGIDELVSRVGGQREDVRGAYKGGTTPDGEEILTVIALSVESVAGADLAAEFRQMTEEDPDAGVSWSDGVAGDRAVAVSRDAADPEVAAYLLSSAEAMYLVIASDETLADAAIRSLP